MLHLITATSKAIPASWLHHECTAEINRRRHLVIKTLQGKYESTRIVKIDAKPYMSDLKDYWVTFTTRSGSEITVSFDNYDKALACCKGVTKLIGEGEAQRSVLKATGAMLKAMA